MSSHKTTNDSLSTIFNSPKTAPAIPVMPGYLYILCSDLFPPFFKFRPCNVVRHRRDEVIKNNIVLFSPSKIRKVIHVVVVKKMASNRLRKDIRRSIQKFCCQKKA